MHLKKKKERKGMQSPRPQYPYGTYMDYSKVG